MSHARQVRLDRGLAQHVAATMAHVSPHTWKLFESNPEAVTPRKRADCEAALAKIAALPLMKSVAA